MLKFHVPVIINLLYSVPYIKSKSAPVVATKPVMCLSFAGHFIDTITDYFTLHSQWETRRAAVQDRVAIVIADTLGRKAKLARVGPTTSWWMEIGSRIMVETTGRHEIGPMNTDIKSLPAIQQETAFARDQCTFHVVV